MYKIENLWINPAHIMYVRDTATMDLITLYFIGEDTLEFRGHERHKVLYMLEKETTTEIGA
jgi:hypothetical protein